MKLKRFSAHAIILSIAATTLLLTRATCCLADNKATQVASNITDESFLFDSDFNASNCVDASINQFCYRTGRTRSKEQIQSAIKSCGLEPSPGHRSLLECCNLLNELNVPVEVIPMNRKVLAATVDPFILFLEPQVKNLPGHAIVLWPHKSSGMWSVFDPRNGKVRTLDAAAEMKNNSFYAVVSKDKVKSARLSVVLRRTLLSAISGLIIGSAIAYYFTFARHLTRPSRISLGSVTVVGILISSLVGCNSQKDLPSVEMTHNFEVIRNAISAEHDFLVKNNTAIPIVCNNIKASCSCISNNSDFLGRKLLPGESFVYPMQIDVTKKVGDFNESLVMEFVKASSEKDNSLVHAFNVVISTSGFVEQDPYASEKLFLFEPSDVDPFERTVDVLFWRAKDSAAPKLKSAIFKNSLAGDSSSNFDLVSSIVQSPVVSGTGLMYTLSMKVRFKGDRSFRWKESDLVLSWEDRPDANTVCHLKGRVKPPFDCVESIVRMSPASVGSESSEFVPIIFNDSFKTSPLHLECDSESFTTTLAQGAGGVVLAFSPKTSGVHNAEVFYAVDKEKVLLFRVTGIGK